MRTDLVGKPRLLLVPASVLAGACAPKIPFDDVAVATSGPGDTSDDATRGVTGRTTGTSAGPTSGRPPPPPPPPTGVTTIDMFECRNDRECPRGFVCEGIRCVPDDGFCDDGCCDDGGGSGGCFGECFSDDDCPTVLFCDESFLCSPGIPANACSTPPVGPALLASALSSDGAAVALAFGDIDGDRDDDLVLLDTSEIKSTETLGAGAWIRTPLPPGTRGRELVLADANADGIEDLIVAVSTNASDTLGNMQVWVATPGTPQTPFSLASSVSIALHDIVVADVNQDGSADVAGLGSPDAPGVSILISQGGGQLSPPIRLSTRDSPYLTTGDLDADGLSDLAFRDRVDTVVLASGQRLTFPPPQRELEDVAIGDMDRDGRPELLGITHIETGTVVHVWRLEGGELAADFSLFVPQHRFENAGFVAQRASPFSLILSAPSGWAQVGLTPPCASATMTSPLPFPLVGVDVGLPLSSGGAALAASDGETTIVMATGVNVRPPPIDLE